MKLLSTITVGSILAGLMTGCAIIEVPTSSSGNGGSIWEVDYPIDAYVDIPYDVREIIYDAVDGYSMPPVDRYGYEIYPVDSRKPYNLPSYVRTDLNGDGYYDYAYMFSAVSWSGGYWYLDTKMLIVTSDPFGYTLSLELDLGTVSGSRNIPVEEYWGIRLLNPGTHTITDYNRGKAYEKSVELPYGGIYLASIDPEERSVFVAEDREISEIVVDFGAIAKKAFKKGVSRERKNVVITESTLGKKAALPL
ncbi:MAG: hypothetical protein JW915_05395 [Chitinispirillaceae bacterium]|nr:hypothetical protein [Chitinispirillaceae bacterium]